MDRNCHIKFELEHNSLIILASDPYTGVSKCIKRDDDSVKKINQMSEMYRMLVARRSFAEENDPWIISSVKELGEQLYAVFFYGLEDFIEPYSNLLLEHSSFQLPLELAFNGKEFISLKYAIGNWMKSFGNVSRIERKEYTSITPQRDFRVLFLGDESDSVYNVFYHQREMPKCEKLKSTWTEHLLEQLNSKNYDVVHFAGHGHFDEKHPEQSFLILDQEKVGHTESIFLRCHQIEHAQLYRTFVFLNACQSGHVEKNYLGFVGFVNSIFRSGATNCITTLWSISDQSASHFAINFYTNLLKGDTIGEALREARMRCWLDKKDILTSLSYVLFGNPKRVVRMSTKKNKVEQNQPDREK